MKYIIVPCVVSELGFERHGITIKALPAYRYPAGTLGQATDDCHHAWPGCGVDAPDSCGRRTVFLADGMRRMSRVATILADETLR